jgi:murein DD-endopeptidase MepM/ murein hydrolase activator NlpD
MPTIPLERRAQPGWSVLTRLALAASALSLVATVSTSCAYAPRTTNRPGAPQPVTQTGEERAGRTDPKTREPDDVAYLRSRGLIIPVVGVRPEQLHDDFYEDRGGGTRQHKAIDILAPYGTPVIAADDGYILRITRNALGGNVIYATDPEERIVYYYAHLAGYFDGVVDGKPIAKGDTIGYVGTSGNAPEDTPPLHFQITRMRPGRRYWDGQPLNPYPLLRHAPEPKREEAVAPQAVTTQATPRPADPAPSPAPPPPPPR